jgi:predicted NAD/FAD-dependent oxidoreductase
MKKDRLTRFGIIGAGAAGLTAAVTLKEMGYQNITILEKESYAGGKCRSVDYEGLSYELGAGIISGNQQTILQLVQKAGLATVPVSFGSYNFYDLQKGGLCEDDSTMVERISFWWQLLLKYRRLCFKYQKVQEPGFTGIDPDLFINFSDWVKTHHLELLQKNLECVFTGFGYGYWEEIPAAYVLKYYSWDALKAYMRREIFCFPDGIQQLWQILAADHQVLFNTTIRAIHRQDVVTIETNKSALEFDVLLLTCPLEEVLLLLEGSPTEKDLFSKIKYNDYQTYACVITDFPNQTGFIPAHFCAEKKGQPIFWYKRYSDTDFYTFYVLGDWHQTEKEITQNIETCIKKLGGSLQQIHSVSRWKYFPHVATEDLQNGFYEKLESIQGEKHTYYMGELLNFSMVESTAAYAKDLVGRCF